MHKTNPQNILMFLLKSPLRIKELIRKIYLRLFDKKSSLQMEKYLNWLSENVVDFEKYAESIDFQIWQEAKAYSHQLKKKAEEILNELPPLGGGGIYPFLYFIVRKLQPDIIVETGIAAGFSSQAFLKAMQVNGKGELYSSDFPMFRLAKPEQYIGAVVEEELKMNWKVYLEGDQINLPIILKKLNKIDIFHYDSDKTYKGREFASNLIQNKISKTGIIIFDDIHNNTHFFDYVSKHKITNYKIFKFERKYVGMINQGAISDIP